MQDPIAAAPDKQGLAGRAWRIDLNAGRRAGHVLSEAPIAGWIVEVPHAHPFWHSYWVSLIHLRPLPGCTPPVLYRPDATHELLLFALDPYVPREPQLTSRMPAFMTPANFLAQLAASTDVAAIARIETTVDLMVIGALNPDTDARRQWIALFGDHCIRPEAR